MPYATIVAYDFSAAADAALDWAAAMHRASGGSVKLVHAVPAPIPDAERDALIERLRAAAASRGLTAEAELLVGPDPGPRIVEYAQEHDAGLVVMGTHGRSGLAQVLLGSVAGHVVRHAHCPVVTLRAPSAPR